MTYCYALVLHFCGVHTKCELLQKLSNTTLFYSKIIIIYFGNNNIYCKVQTLVPQKFNLSYVYQSKPDY